MSIAARASIRKPKLFTSEPWPFGKTLNLKNSTWQPLWTISPRWNKTLASTCRLKNTFTAPRHSPENSRAKRCQCRHDTQQFRDVLQRAGKVYRSGAPASARAWHLGRITRSGTPKGCRGIMQYLNGMEKPGQIFRGGSRPRAFFDHLGKGIRAGASEYC